MVFKTDRIITGRLDSVPAISFDIIVGSAGQVTSEVATHTVSDFVADISNGDRILFLNGTHTLVRNENITEDDIELVGESTQAILDFAGDTIVFDQVWAVDDTPTGNEYIDETADANSATNADFTPFTYSAVEAIGDYCAFGLAEPFGRIFLDGANGTAGVGGVVDWEYWDGSAWSLLEVSDGTSGFTKAVTDIASADQIVSWEMPIDWAALVINGSSSLYYVRAIITTVYSTNPIYDQGFIRGMLTVSGNRARGMLRTSNAIAHDINVSGVNSEIQFEEVSWSGNMIAPYFPLDHRTLPQWTFGFQVGVDFNIPTVSNTIITALTPTTVAYYDTTNSELRTYEFDGSTWSLTGSGLPIAAQIACIIALNETDIAFYGTGIDELRLYRWGGSTWTEIGTAISIVVSAGTCRITALNGTDVALSIENNNSFQAYRWGGSSWATLGNEFDYGASPITIQFCAMNGTDVAWYETISDDIRMLHFDGSDWTQISADTNVTGTSLPNFSNMVALNGTDILANDAANGDIRIYRFNGSHWNKIGLPTIVSTTSNNGQMTPLNGTDIAFIDIDDEDLRVIRFNFDQQGKPYSVAGGAF